MDQFHLTLLHHKSRESLVIMARLGCGIDVAWPTEKSLGNATTGFLS